jgi:hypothetical protein
MKSAIERFETLPDERGKQFYDRSLLRDEYQLYLSVLSPRSRTFIRG